MKERILKLCKRLNKFSLDEIATIADDVDEIVLELLLQTLIDEKFLIQQKDTYFYNKKNPTKNYSMKLPKVFMYHSKEEIDLIITCFCAEIPTHKACYLIKTSDDTIQRFYNIFRKLIYEKQHKILVSLYSINPQEERYRIFFDKYAYFYIYNNTVYVAEKPLKAVNKTTTNKHEVKEFKKICCYLSRIEQHNKNKISLHYKIAEALWRRNKDFNELYSDIKNNIIC